MADILRYVDTDAPGGGDGSIGSPYNSIASWNANEAGAVAAGDRHICNLRTPTTPDRSLTNLNGWSGAGELIIQRWPGEASALIQPDTDSSHGFLSPPDLAKCTWYHIDMDMSLMDAYSQEMIRIISTCEVRRCRFSNTGAGSSQDHVYIGDASPAPITVDVSDCSFHTCNRGAVFNQRRNDAFMSIINCVAWNFYGEIPEHAVFGCQSDQIHTGTTLLIANCAAHFTNNATCFNASPTTTIDSRSDYNRSSDASATNFGANSVNNVIFQEGPGGSGNRAMYVSLTDPVDLHIIDDPANTVRDTGAGPAHPSLGSVIPATDYDGDARSGLTADIGFDQIPGVGPVPQEVDISLASIQNIISSSILAIISDIALSAEQNMDAQTLAIFNPNMTIDAASFMDVDPSLIVSPDIGMDMAHDLSSGGQYIVNINVGLENQTTLDPSVQAIFYADMITALTTSIGLFSGGSFEGDIELDAIQLASFSSDLGVLADIALALVSLLTLDGESTQGGVVGLNWNSVLETRVLATMGVDIEFASNHILTIDKISIQDAGVELVFNCHMDLQWFDVGPVEIITPDGRTLKIAYNDRKLSILMQKRDYQITEHN